MVGVSIVIPHYGERDLTLACCTAVESATPADQYELLIIDNGTGHELPGRVVRNETNEGFARACNRGARMAANDLVLFLNNDTIPQEGWLAPLVEAVEQDGVAAAGSGLVGPDGRPERALPRLVRLPDGRLDTENMPLEGPARDVRLLCAASLIVSRDAFWSVGGFDEAYWNGHEDVDLCLKFQGMGWRLRFVPESRVLHRVSQGGRERHVSATENIDRLHRRWRGRAEPDVSYPMSAAALARRAGRALLGSRRRGRP